MKIQQVNNYNNISMTGNIILKNPYTRSVNEAIKKSRFFKKLSSNNDVVVRMAYNISEDGNYNFLYKIKYTLLKENSIFDKALDFLHLKPIKEYLSQYKSADELIGMLEG